MSTHILTSLRQFVLRRVLKAIPFGKSRPSRSEPVKPSQPAVDGWMFEASPSVTQNASDLSLGMTSLASSLSSLHGIVSDIAVAAPLPCERKAPALQAAVWKDADLFDEPPRAARQPRPVLNGEADFLFDDVAPVERADIALVAGAARQPSFDRPEAT